MIREERVCPGFPMRRIKVDPGIQFRIEFHDEVAWDYAALIKGGNPLHGRSGTEYPVAFDDGTTIWLSDGFHRFEGHRILDHKAIDIKIKPGTRRDALLYGIAANLANPVRPDVPDRKRAALLILREVLDDPEWAAREKISDRKIGDLTDLSHQTVGVLREQLEAELESGRGDQSEEGLGKRPVTLPEARKKAFKRFNSLAKFLEPFAREDPDVRWALGRLAKLCQRFAPPEDEPPEPPAQKGAAA